MSLFDELDMIINNLYMPREALFWIHGLIPKMKACFNWHAENLRRETWPSTGPWRRRKCSLTWPSTHATGVPAGRSLTVL